MIPELHLAARRALAHRLADDLLLLEHAKQLDLDLRRQFADFALRQPTATEITTWTKNLEANQAPATLTDTLRTAKTWDGTVGPVTRLY